MLPSTFPEQNFVYTKPGNMTDEQCGDLPVLKSNYSDGSPAIISCWKLSKEDLEEIQQTGCVWLNICANGMPPVSLSIEKPF